MNTDDLLSDAFTINLSGYRRADVDEYIDRVAAVIDMLEDADPQPITSLPFDLRPKEVKDKDFKISWRGYDQDEVRSRLYRLSTVIDLRTFD